MHSEIYHSTFTGTKKGSTVYNFTQNSTTQASLLKPACYHIFNSMYCQTISVVLCFLFSVGKGNIDVRLCIVGCFSVDFFI